MNKSTEKAVEAARKVIDRVNVNMGIEFDEAICKLGKVEEAELKKQVDALMAKRAEALSAKVMNAFRATLGL
jgi:hypothetical protein